MQLHFKVTGSGPAVILLHGLLGSLDNWHPVAQRLAGRFQVYALDQRNHGQSPHSADMNFPLMAEDLNEFLVSQGIPRAVFEKAVRGSLTVGAYASSGEMAAMARVVTDRATFGWICDVFVDRAARGQGLGKAIMAYIGAHPELQGFRRMHLATRDAHALYAQFGFVPLTGVDRWMEVRRANPYRVSPRTRPAPASAP